MKIKPEILTRGGQATANQIANNRWQALTRLDDDEKGVISTDTLGGQQDMSIIVGRQFEEESLATTDEQLYADAVTFVREYGKANASALQRKFVICYSCAAKLLNAMEQSGVVTAPNHKGQREVIPA